MVHPLGKLKNACLETFYTIFNFYKLLREIGGDN